MLPDSLVTIIFMSVPVSFGLFEYFVSEQKGNSPIIGFILCFIWSILGVIIVLSLRAKNKNYTDKFKDFGTKITFSTEKLYLKDKRFVDTPLYFYRAESDSLQKMTLGPFKNSEINFKRYKNLNLESKFEISELLPHPLA